TKIFAIREGFHPPSEKLARLFRFINLEAGLMSGLAMLVGGAIVLIIAFWRWESVGFGHLDPHATTHIVIPAVVLLSLGVQTVFASFFLSILGIGRQGTADLNLEGGLETPSPQNLGL